MAQIRSSKGRGCFFYGCIGAVVLGLLLVVGIIFGVRYALNSFVQKFTDTAPMDFPEVALSPTEAEDLKKRLTEFWAAVKAGRETEPLVLSPEEVNALILDSRVVADMNARAFVELDEDLVKGRISIPLRFGRSEESTRYLNATGVFNVGLENGRLVVEMKSATVKGEPIPAKILASLQEENLAEEFNKRPENAEFIRHLSRIEIRDGKMVVVPKTAAEPPIEQPEPDPAPQLERP